VIMFLGLNCDILYFYFYQNAFFLLPLFCPVFYPDLTSIFFRIILGKIVLVFLCRIMSAISSQRRVRQRTEEERSALQTKIMDRVGSINIKFYIIANSIMVDFSLKL
jgi:hypothetical protein